MEIEAIFEQFAKLRVLIVGDLMIDSYIWGKAERISPEAPVPVVNVQRREKRPGGAANVALNVLAIGAKPVLCSVIGTDDAGEDALRVLADAGLSCEGILQSPERPTTVKHRILAGTQQLLRVDSETDRPLSAGESAEFCSRVISLMDGADVLIFEDYDKGVLTAENIARLIAEAKKRGIPTTVDPKKRNFFAYGGCTLFKPNLKELREGLGTHFEPTDRESLREAGNLLRQQTGSERILVTLSEHGVFASDGRSDCFLPAHKRAIADVSGAGDTVIGIVSCCLALGLSQDFMAALSNLAGGLVCEQPGVVPVSAEKLLYEARKHLVVL